MKFASFLLTTLLTVSSFGATTLHTTIVGRVVFQKTYTMTCMSTGCPPSLPYFQLTLDDAQVDGIGPVEAVIFQDYKPTLGQEEKPSIVEYGGVALKEGIYIIVEADVRWNQSGDKIFAVATNPEEVKLIPVRHPGMLF